MREKRRREERKDSGRFGGGIRHLSVMDESRIMRVGGRFGGNEDCGSWG